MIGSVSDGISFDAFNRYALNERASGFCLDVRELYVSRVFVLFGTKNSLYFILARRVLNGMNLRV